MSTVRLLKDCDGKKAGETVSVPFIRGKGMVATGLAEYPEAAAAKPAAASPEVAAALHQRIAALEKENVELKELLATVTAPDDPDTDGDEK